LYEEKERREIHLLKLGLQVSDFGGGGSLKERENVGLHRTLWGGVGVWGGGGGGRICTKDDMIVTIVLSVGLIFAVRSRLTCTEKPKEDDPARGTCYEDAQKAQSKKTKESPRARKVLGKNAVVINDLIQGEKKKGISKPTVSSRTNQTEASI